MRVPEWIFITYIVSVLLFSLAFLLYFLKEIVVVWQQKKLRRKVYQALLAGDLTLSDFKNIPLVIGLNDRKVHAALIHLKADVDCGEYESRDLVKPRLDTLIEKFNTYKPFSELPEGLVEPLNEARIKSTEPKVIENLSEKILIHLKRQAKSDLYIKIATYVGLIVGLIGTFSGLLK